MRIDSNSAGYTLVEMLIALAVGSIVVGGAYASYSIVANQYNKIKDVSEMHTSGRNIMRMIERDIRMAGFEYRDAKANVVYGSISEPLIIKDSGNKCCDEVTVTYDYHDNTNNKTERVRIRYWAENYTGAKGTRGRLYRKRDILMPKTTNGGRDVLADYIEDLQVTGIETDEDSGSFVRFTKLGKDGGALSESAKNWSCVRDNKTDLIWEVKTDDSGLHDRDVRYTYLTTSWYHPSTDALSAPTNNKGLCGFVHDRTCKTTEHCKWRVPTYPELKELVLTGKGHPTINTNFFPNTKSAEYWTSSVNSFGYGKRLLNFGTGKGVDISGYGRHSNEYARLVYLPTDSSKSYHLVGVDLVIRSKKEYGQNKKYDKKNYFSGNYKITKNDGYKRDEFSNSVLVRNLAL